MSCLNLPLNEVIKISEEASLYDAAKLMDREHVGAIVVVRQTESSLMPVGMITDRDMMLKLFKIKEGEDPRKIHIKEAMGLAQVQETPSLWRKMVASLISGFVH